MSDYINAWHLSSGAYARNADLTNDSSWPVPTAAFCWALIPLVRFDAGDCSPEVTTPSAHLVLVLIEA